MELELNGRKINISSALPLTIGDWKALEKRKVTLRNLESASITDLSAVVFHVLHKADDTVKEEEVDALPLTSGVIAVVTEAIRRSQEEPEDVPFSTPSTSSRRSTAGVKKT